MKTKKEEKPGDVDLINLADNLVEDLIGEALRLTVLPPPSPPGNWFLVQVFIAQFLD